MRRRRWLDTASSMSRSTSSQLMPSRRCRMAFSPPVGNGETILIVDDERALAQLGEEMVAALGYEPVGFDDSTRALAAFRADPQRFDLVLADETMPGMTGARLAAA